MSDFLSTMIKNAVAKYNNAATPTAYNSSLGRSEDCTVTAPNAAWSISFTLDEKGRDELEHKARQHFSNVKKTDSRLGSYGGIHSMRKQDDGSVMYTARKKCMTAKGKQNPEPKIVDGKKFPVENRDFWGGSKINLMVTLLPTNSPASGEWGVSILLDAIQVVEPVFGSDEREDFDVISDQSVTAASEFEDEIPFG